MVSVFSKIKSMLHKKIENIVAEMQESAQAKKKKKTMKYKIGLPN